MKYLLPIYFDVQVLGTDEVATEKRAIRVWFCTNDESPSTVAAPQPSDDVVVTPRVHNRFMIGLAEARDLGAAIGAFVDALEPDVIAHPDVVPIWETVLAGAQRMNAAVTLLARRVEETRGWERTGHRSAAEFVAKSVRQFGRGGAHPARHGPQGRRTARDRAAAAQWRAVGRASGAGGRGCQREPRRNPSGCWSRPNRGR